MSLASLIRERRMQLKISQTALGLRVFPGTAASNASVRIRRFESGAKPKVHELSALAKALEIDVSELMEAELGEGWSQEVVDGGFVVNKLVLDRYPDLRGILDVLNTCMVNGLPEAADQMIKNLANLRVKDDIDQPKKKVKPTKKSKA